MRPLSYTGSSPAADDPLQAKFGNTTHTTRKWRNWQTHQLEGLAVAISWGFESPLPHQTLSVKKEAANDGLIVGGLRNGRCVFVVIVQRLCNGLLLRPVLLELLHRELKAASVDV